MIGQCLQFGAADGIVTMEVAFVEPRVCRLPSSEYLRARLPIWDFGVPVASDSIQHPAVGLRSSIATLKSLRLRPAKTKVTVAGFAAVLAISKTDRIASSISQSAGDPTPGIMSIATTSPPSAESLRLSRCFCIASRSSESRPTLVLVVHLCRQARMRQWRDQVQARVALLRTGGYLDLARSGSYTLP